MKSVGEVMSIGRTFREALGKGIRSLENGRPGLGFAKDFQGVAGWGWYNREANPEGILLPQQITEFTNAGICAGIATVNLAAQTGSVDFLPGVASVSALRAAVEGAGYGVPRVEPGEASIQLLIQDAQGKLFYALRPATIGITICLKNCSIHPKFLLLNIL